MGTRGAKPPQSEDQPHETAAGLTGGGSGVPDGQFIDDSQSDLIRPSHVQDAFSTRAKGTRHGKVTAENANQGESPRGR